MISPLILPQNFEDISSFKRVMHDMLLECMSLSLYTYTGCTDRMFRGSVYALLMFVLYITVLLQVGITRESINLC